MNHTHSRRAALLLPLLAACVADSRWPRIETQQWPAPMEDVPGALDSSSMRGVISNEPGVEEVSVLRYGDPVQVRPAGATASYPLPFHDKEVQLKAGSWVLCSPGGKVEILWTSGTSIVFSGRTTGLVGSPSRGEPTFAFVELENALLYLRPNDQVRLLGGAWISAEVGPVALERLNSGIFRVENQSKKNARIRFRDADLQLGPSEEVHLPLLSAGGEPWAGAFDNNSAPNVVPLHWDGEARVISDKGGVRVIPDGEGELRGLGLRMQFAAGESLFIHGFNYDSDPSVLSDARPDDGGERDAKSDPEPDRQPKPEPKPEEWVPADQSSEGAESTSAGDGA